MAPRLRKIVWIISAVILTPVALAALYWTYLALRPSPPLPKSSLLAPPAHLRASSGRGQVTLLWDDVPGAISYRVFRSDKAGGGYRALGTGLESASALMRPLLEASTPPPHIPRSPYVDTLVENRTYYYEVRAFDGSGWSEPSTPLAAAPGGGDGSVWVRADVTREAAPIERPWEVAIGSEQLGYYFKEDAGRGLRNAGVALRRSNKRLHDSFRFRYLRAPGILSDTLACYHETPDGRPVYDWSRIDVAYDAVISDGLRPIVDLSYMPAALAASPRQTIFDYRAVTSPPKDYRKWGDLIGALARHLMERYGRDEVASWPFEVWNEPDATLPFEGSYWRGTTDGYYRLYDFSASALKSVDQRIRVGGPAAARVESIEPFLRHASTSNFADGSGHAPLDFLSVHAGLAAPLDFGPLCERYGFRDLPVYYTSWGASSYGAPENDLPYGAARTAAVLMQGTGKAAMLSYRSGSDYFEEQGPPKRLLHGGLGLLGIDGLRKPRYWAFALLHALDGPQIAVEGGGDGFGGLIQARAVHDTDGRVAALISNAAWEPSQAVGKAELDREVTLRVVGLAAGQRYRLRHYRVDKDHSNIYAAWAKLGRPDWPQPVPLAKLREGDRLDLLEDDKDIVAGNEGTVELQFALPMPGLSMLIFSPLSPPVENVGP